MTIKFLAFLVTFLLISCSYKRQETTTNSLAKSNKKNYLSERINNQDVIQVLLNLPDWQWVYHAGSKQRLPIKLLKNDIISSDLKLKKFGQPVMILSMKQLNELNAEAYVCITKLNLLHDTVYFSMNYPYEGAFADGILIKKGKWIAGDYSVVER